MMAYLSTRMVLIHGQTVSSPIALAGLWELTISSLYSLTCILGQTPVPVIVWPCYIYRLSQVQPGTYTTWSLDPVVQHAWHLEDHNTWAKLLLSKLRCSLPCPSVWQLLEKTHSTWLARQITMVLWPDSPCSPHDTLLLPHDTVTPIEPMQGSILWKLTR